MARIFNGQVHVRIAPKVHREVAQEAFDKGTSISGIFSQALIVRNALKNIDPWKAIDEVQAANRKVSKEELDGVIAKAVKDVRRHGRG
jgi:hypothetical protein